MMQSMPSTEELVAAAQANTGLADFGADSFREGLGRLVDALNAEAALSERGVMAMKMQIIDLLSVRLRVEHWYAENRGFVAAPFQAPLIGLGLPRTASTALACLLGEDPATRSLTTWESMAPIAPTDPAHWREDPRLERAEMAMERRAAAHPRLTGMLPSTATSPTECQLLMAQDFRSQIFQAFVHVPGYVEWLVDQADLKRTYRHVERVLSLVAAAEAPRPWRLKNPSHSLFIRDLDRVFPDARFVMTHRHPADVIASVADLYFEYRQSFSDHVDLVAIGRETTQFCETAMRRMMGFRDAGNDERFFDIDFDEFQADQMGTVAALYEWLGTELSPEAASRMEGWRLDRPLSSARYERTDPARFGLVRGEIEERFAFYTQRFGL